MVSLLSTFALCATATEEWDDRYSFLAHPSFLAGSKSPLITATSVILELPPTYKILPKILGIERQSWFYVAGHIKRCMFENK